MNFVSSVSYIFSGVGAFFLCRSYLNVTAKDLALQTKTFIGGNDHLLNSLVQQNADAMIGFFLTLLGVVIGFASNLTAITIDPTTSWQFIVAVLILTFILSLSISKKLFLLRLRSARLHNYSFFVDEYIPDWNQDGFKIDRVVEAIKDFHLQGDDNDTKNQYDRVIHLLELVQANHTIQKIKNYQSRTSK